MSAEDIGDYKEFPTKESALDWLEKIIIKVETKKRKEHSKEMIRAQRKRHELKRERRIKNVVRIDKDITLERLFNRDGGKCYLCGSLCDYKDYKITSEGHFVAMANYPSIDYVMPLSKGGAHTWENVKLAHMACNTKKSDNAPPP